MKPRIEQKAELNKFNYIAAYDWLNFNKFNVLYPERIVCSIYFDNLSMQSFYDTSEGICPRRKIRIRKYINEDFNKENDIYTLETKLTTDFERLKNQQKIIDVQEKLSSGVFDNQYGLCTPIIKISYIREYFIFKTWRVTIDKSIKYEKYKDCTELIYDDSCVLEIKTSIDEDITELKNFFNFPRSRFSKYQRGIEALKLYK